MKPEIVFHISYGDKKVEVKTYPYEYRSLMALLYDKFYFEDFGDCKGIGRCGTCLVTMEEAPPKLLTRQGNEQTTLKKMEHVPHNSRLSCQILITEEIHQLHFIIAPDLNPGLY